MQIPMDKFFALCRPRANHFLQWQLLHSSCNLKQLALWGISSISAELKLRKLFASSFAMSYSFCHSLHFEASSLIAIQITVISRCSHLLAKWLPMASNGFQWQQQQLLLASNGKKANSGNFRQFVSQWAHLLQLQFQLQSDYNAQKG